jgi:hypothetical protein
MRRYSGVISSAAAGERQSQQEDALKLILRQTHRFRLAAQPGTIPFVETCAFVGTNPQNEANFVYCSSLGVP